MIKSRQEILSLNQTFSEHLISVQNAKYKPAYEWTEGESAIIDNSGKAVILTKEQADKLNKDDQKYFINNRDNYFSKNLNNWIGKATLISTKADSINYLLDVGQSLEDLSKEFGKLIILGDWNTPWLNQENDYPPAAEAIEYLNQTIDKDFNGGFLIGHDQILEFVSHLFWLTRCNASLPEFMMAFENSKSIFGICKYGVLHLEFYDSQEREKILEFYDSKNFKEVEKCSDPIDFDNFNGRKIKISS